MIIVLSPSKNMDMAAVKLADASQPDFLARSELLITELRRLSNQQLMAFMGISEKLADLNRQRFKEWNLPFTLDNAKQSLLAFTGDVYEGLGAATLNKRDIQYAQNHLRILSGLYGLLRPLDLIQPYRLEMGRPLQAGDAKNLYEFWRDAITETLNAEPGILLVNLASQEYFKAINTKTLNKKIISPVFKDEKNGKFKIISFYAKKARGTMARYLIENRVANVEGMLGFSEDGYAYNPDFSKPDEPVFTRSER